MLAGGKLPGSTFEGYIKRGEGRNGFKCQLLKGTSVCEHDREEDAASVNGNTLRRGR